MDDEKSLKELIASEKDSLARLYKERRLFEDPNDYISTQDTCDVKPDFIRELSLKIGALERSLAKHQGQLERML